MDKHTSLFRQRFLDAGKKHFDLRIARCFISVADTATNGIGELDDASYLAHFGSRCLLARDEITSSGPFGSTVQQRFYGGPHDARSASVFKDLADTASRHFLKAMLPTSLELPKGCADWEWISALFQFASEQAPGSLLALEPIFQMEAMLGSDRSRRLGPVLRRATRPYPFAHALTVDPFSASVLLIEDIQQRSERVSLNQLARLVGLEEKTLQNRKLQGSLGPPAGRGLWRYLAARQVMLMHFPEKADRLPPLYEDAMRLLRKLGVR